MSVLAWLEGLISGLEPAFLQLLNMSITASYVILAVLLARLLLRRLPKRYSYALWAVVAFRLLCPVSISSLLSIFNIGVFDMTAATQGAELVYIPGNIGMMREPSVSVGIPPLNAFISESLPTPAPAASVNPLQIWQFAGTFVWVLGILALLVYAAISLAKLRRQVRGAVRMAGTADVFECDGVRSPFVLGFFRPRIYLPFRLTEAERAHVLAHERVHLRRGDHIVKPLAFLLTAVYWFNPLVWAAYICMCADMEMRCDEAVLSALPEGRRADYSMSLLALGTGRHFAAASPLAFGETGVKRRVKNALSFQKPAVWLAALAAALCIFVAVACGTNADPETDGDALVENLGVIQPEIYQIADQLYLSPLSSDLRIPARTYEFQEDALIIRDAETQEILLDQAGADWQYQEVDEAEFTALFMLNAPDLSKYETRLECRPCSSIIVYKMDDEVWLGRTGTHGGAHKGEEYMWSLYRLERIPITSTGSGLPLADRRLRPGRYATEDGTSWVALHEDGTFVWVTDITISYAPHGTWSSMEDALVLLVGEEAYHFTVEPDGSAIRLEQDAAGSVAAHGSRFVYQGAVPQSWGWETYITSSEEGVEEFLTAAGSDVTNTGYENDVCYNVTPWHISEVWFDRFRIFKYDRSCASYLLYEGTVYPLGAWFGGYGFTDAAVGDLNQDGVEELYFTCSWGSGVHRAQAGYFDAARKDVIMFEFSYAANESGSELALRADDEGIGVFAAEPATESFVDFTLTPKGRLGTISLSGGQIAFQASETERGSALDYWGGAASRMDWLAQYRAAHAGEGAALTAKEQAALSELAYYVSTCEPLAPEQPLAMEPHVARAFYVYCWDAYHEERYWEPEGGRLPAFGTVLQSEDFSGKNAVALEPAEAEALTRSIFGRSLPEDAAGYDDSSFFYEDSTYFQTFGDYWMWFERFEEIVPLADGEYYVRYVINCNPMGPEDEWDDPTERTGELIVRRDTESRFGFSVRAIVRTPWEQG